MIEVAVRVGTPADIDGMMRLAEAACEENGLTRADTNKLLQEIWSALNLHHGIVGVIGETDTRLEAAILLRTEEMWYSNEPSLVERAVFVHPDFRSAKGGRAARLVEFAKQAAENLGMPLVIGIISSQRTEAKIKMYQRHLGEPSGAYWIWNAKTGAEKVSS